jgi:multidrug resistance efflux pump
MEEKREISQPHKEHLPQKEQAKHVPARKKNVKPLIIAILVLLGLVGSAVGIWYYEEQQKYVYTDKASISVPLIQLTSKSPGILKDVFVYDGESVAADETVARVGDEMISAEIPGKILTAKRDFGAIYNPGQSVVTMMDPKEMRVVALVQEDKGLSDLRVLQKVKFTVDAFGSREFEGFVEEISEMSHEGDVVFNISDKRQEQEFEVKIRYDLKQYPMFQNGMSAKVWIVK